MNGPAEDARYDASTSSTKKGLPSVTRYKDRTKSRRTGRSTATTVRTVRAVPQGFEIKADDEVLHAQAVVAATGACNQPVIPGTADAVPPPITMLTPLTYRDPGLLPDGGVLVVGASATPLPAANNAPVTASTS